jgi:hypothetical protein
MRILPARSWNARFADRLTVSWLCCSSVNRQTPFVAETRRIFDPVLLIQLVSGSDRVIVGRLKLIPIPTLRTQWGVDGLSGRIALLIAEVKPRSRGAGRRRRRA